MPPLLLHRAQFGGKRQEGKGGGGYSKRANAIDVMSVERVRRRERRRREFVRGHADSEGAGIGHWTIYEPL